MDRAAAGAGLGDHTQPPGGGPSLVQPARELAAPLR